MVKDKAPVQLNGFVVSENIFEGIKRGGYDFRRRWMVGKNVGGVYSIDSKFQASSSCLMH